MALVRVDFRASNNADWSRAFSLTIGSAGVAPWSSVAAWSAGTQYSSASVVQYLGDLYVGKGTPTLGAFNVSEWTLVGSKALFTATPLDLTGATLKMQARALNAPNSPLLTATDGDGLIITNAPQGSLAIQIPAARVRGLPAGAYSYDLLITQAGKITRALYGTITVDEGVTR